MSTASKHHYFYYLSEWQGRLHVDTHHSSSSIQTDWFTLLTGSLLYVHTVQCFWRMLWSQRVHENYVSKWFNIFKKSFTFFLFLCFVRGDAVINLVTAVSLFSQVVLITISLKKKGIHNAKENVLNLMFCIWMWLNEVSSILQIAWMVLLCLSLCNTQIKFYMYCCILSGKRFCPSRNVIQILSNCLHVYRCNVAFHHKVSGETLKWSHPGRLGARWDDFSGVGMSSPQLCVHCGSL